MKGLKLRLSRTLILVMGGLLLVGGSGAAALYVGSDRIFGPSYLEVNGLECTTLQEMKLKQDQHTWVRRYVFTDGGDGAARLRTAVRVAKAVQAAEKADLVQVTVLDKGGPTQRAAMRGRAIGAQVVYIPDAAKAPDPGDPTFSAFYVEGAATHGEFYGLRITPPLEDVEKIAAVLTDSADCVSPVVETEADPHGGGHDAKGAEGHGKSSGKDKASSHGEPSGHGEAPAAESGHVPAPAEGEHGAEGASNEGEHGAESGGLISSITSKIFGSKTEVTAQDGHGGTDAAQAEGQQAADHTVPTSEHTAVAPQPGFVDRIKGMVFGDPKTDVVVMQPSPAAAATPSPAQGDHATPDTAPHDGIDPMKVAAPTEAAKQQDPHGDPADTAVKPSH